MAKVKEARRRSPSRRSKPVSRKPQPPFPEQSQRRPGIEAKMTPRPAYMAPGYRGFGKLAGKVALITGGDLSDAQIEQTFAFTKSFVFFASNADSSYITGEVLTLLGGATTAA
jgi:hypothetical protein